jgi:hypothetical protein
LGQIGFRSGSNRLPIGFPRARPPLIAFALSALPCQFSNIESLPRAPIVQLTMRSFIGDQQNARGAEGAQALA